MKLVPKPAPGQEDQGAALVLVLVLVIITSLIVLPTMDFAISVSRASRVTVEKAQREEAVKGGLRMALADPTALYRVCQNAGLNNGPELRTPQRGVSTKTTCMLMDTAFAEDDDMRPFGVVTTQATTTTPPWFTATPERAEGVYPGGTTVQADTALWYRDYGSLNRRRGTAVTPNSRVIWTPNLPVHALTVRLPFADSMPAEFGACNVFFPGTYTQAITLSSATPTYFTSGIYYFEQPLTITGDANVVVGGGSVEGCTSDQEAAFYANNAPATHNITGLGATFVFGYEGRLVVDNSVPATTAAGISVVFNQRYVHTSDTNSLPSATVNIMSVNGALQNSDLTKPLTNLSVPGVLQVPKSLAPTTNGAFGDATLNKYRPSVLVPPDLITNPTATETEPIIKIDLVTASPVTIDLPGYVYVPQGRFYLNIPAGAGLAANKSITFQGGVVARTIEIPGDIPGDTPAKFKMGVEDVVVQLVLRIRTETTSGMPKIVSDAIVQVNKNGAYAVNSWSVQ